MAPVGATPQVPRLAEPAQQLEHEERNAVGLGGEERADALRHARIDEQAVDQLLEGGGVQPRDVQPTEAAQP